MLVTRYLCFLGFYTNAECLVCPGQWLVNENVQQINAAKFQLSPMSMVNLDSSSSISFGTRWPFRSYLSSMAQIFVRSSSKIHFTGGAQSHANFMQFHMGNSSRIEMKESAAAEISLMQMLSSAAYTQEGGAFKMDENSILVMEQQSEMQNLYSNVKLKNSSLFVGKQAEMVFLRTNLSLVNSNIQMGEATEIRARVVSLTDSTIKMERRSTLIVWEDRKLVATGMKLIMDDMAQLFIDGNVTIANRNGPVNIKIGRKGSLTLRGNCNLAENIVVEANREQLKNCP